MLNYSGLNLKCWGYMFKIEMKHDNRVLIEAVREVVESLPQREQMVIDMKYGISGAEHSESECAHLLGITRQRVNQIHRSAINLLMRKPKMQKVKKIMREYGKI